MRRLQATTWPGPAACCIRAATLVVSPPPCSHAQVVADAADDDEARVEALADAKRDPVGRPELVLVGIERLPDAERRVHGPPRVVLVRHGGPNSAMIPSPRN